MDIKLFDTFTRSLRKLEASDPSSIGLYCCGPTVYDYAHIGNLRTYVFEDVLRRVLEFNGYNVRHVMNITDVGHLVSDEDTGEDKMMQAARRTGESAWDLADEYTQTFRDDLRDLNILEPTLWCRATEHIAEQIDLIRCLEAKGFTYRTSDGIYFDSLKLPDYGHLGRLDIQGLRAGSRVEMGEKRAPTDFALWKFSPADRKRQMEWDSPWGTGFPGWHTECAAMSVKYLGTFFDIHCGGEDHIPVHHTNEIAQGEACYGTRLANIWMHGHFLQVDDKKMAKSSGEFLVLQNLIARNYDPLAYRLFCLGAQYRASLTFSWEGLDAAATALNRLRAAVADWDGPATSRDEDYTLQFRECLNDDLNMPRALAVVWDLVKSERSASVKKATLFHFDKVLGLRLAEWQPADSFVPDDILALVELRQRARAEKRWQDADALRSQVLKAGYEIEDTPQGSRVRAIAK